MTQSEDLFERACKVTPGGVNSPVRAFRGVGGTPLFFESSDGAYLTDVDGKRYVDYVGSWGPMIAGHNNPVIREAVEKAVKKGLSFGAPTPGEVELAEWMCAHFPSVDKIRFVNSGTEATMTALRLARGYTGREKIIKFAGCYHGHSDHLLVKAGSGGLTLGIPNSLGVPPSVVEHTLTATYNDLESVRALFQTYPDEIAGIILEPVVGNMNCVPPIPGFLEGLRQLCDEYRSVLVIDEVMTGFRVHPLGAHLLYNIRPDLTTFGKVIGGGMPVGAIGGRNDIMDLLAPIGGVYQAGTLSGNPIAMAAGLACLKLISEPHYFDSIFQMTTLLMQGFEEIAKQHGIALKTQHVGAMFGFYFNALPKIENLDHVLQSNESAFKFFFHGMLAEGFYFAPSAYEAGFVSKAHDERIIQATLDAASRVFKKMKEDRIL